MIATNNAYINCKMCVLQHNMIYVPFVYDIFMHLIDIDECLSSPCEHMCTNTVGSFQCSCSGGYQLGSNGKSCRGKFIY